MATYPRQLLVLLVNTQLVLWMKNNPILGTTDMKFAELSGYCYR